jgi:hypothetical protein
MSEEKLKVAEYNGPETRQTGDVKYWDGENWVILSPGTQTQALTSHEAGSEPTWENT